MIQKYLLSILLTLSFALSSNAQDGKDLGFYPNPVTNGKIFITSKTALQKEVTIYNVLGKAVLQQTTSKEVNISTLPAGVYIVKLKEGEATLTRKLIIK